MFCGWKIDLSAHFTSSVNTRTNVGREELLQQVLQISGKYRVCRLARPVGCSRRYTRVRMMGPDSMCDMRLVAYFYGRNPCSNS